MDADPNCAHIVAGSLIPSCCWDNLKDVQEQVDDIQVQVQCSKYVLFWWDGVHFASTHHDLCIIHKVLQDKTHLNK